MDEPAPAMRFGSLPLLGAKRRDEKGDRGKTGGENKSEK